MSRAVFLLLVLLAVEPAASQPVNRVDYELASVRPFIVDTTSGERRYADDLDALLYRDGEYADELVRFEVCIERLSETPAKLMALRLERYALLQNLSSSYYEGLESAYPDLDAKRPVWAYDDTLLASFHRSSRDERTEVISTEPIRLQPEGWKSPAGYDVLGYAFRFSVSVPNLRDQDVDVSNNSLQLIMASPP